MGDFGVVPYMHAPLFNAAVSPLDAGWTRPTIHLRADGQTDSDEPFAKVNDYQLQVTKYLLSKLPITYY
jgi:hypothetical protein